MCVSSTLNTEIQLELFLIVNSEECEHFFNSANKKEMDDILAVCVTALSDKKVELRSQAEVFLKT